MPTFTYVGPLDEVELVVRVKRGEQITVPDAVAGRPPHQEHDADGVLLVNDVGEGLLAQAHAWQLEPVDLGSLTVDKLRDLAEARGIDLTGVTKKADIVAAIAATDENQEG